MGYSREQINQMFNIKMQSVMTKIDRARQDEETTAHNDYIARQEKMAQASLALSALKTGSTVRDSWINKKLKQTYGDDPTKAGLYPKKFEMKEGFHPFAPTQKTKGYKAFEQQDVIKKIEKGVKKGVYTEDQLKQAKANLKDDPDKFRENYEAGAYDALVMSEEDIEAQGLIKEQMPDTKLEEFDPTIETAEPYEDLDMLEVDTQEDQLYKQMRAESGITEVGELPIPKPTDIPTEDLQRMREKASIATGEHLKRKAAESLPGREEGIFPTGEISEKISAAETAEKIATKTAELEATPTKVDEMPDFLQPSEAILPDPLHRADISKSLLKGARGEVQLQQATEREASIKQFTEETGLEYSPEMYRKWQDYELPSDLTGDIASTDVDTMEDVIALDGGDIVPDVKEIPDVEALEVKPKDIVPDAKKIVPDATPDVEALEVAPKDVEIPDAKPEVEIPDAKPGILKTGKDVLGDVQAGVGLATDIKKAGEGDVLSGVKATGTLAEKVGGKLTEKAVEKGTAKVVEETGEVVATKAGEKVAGKALATAGKVAGSAVGVFTGLKTALDEEQSDVQRVGGGMQALGSGMYGAAAANIWNPAGWVTGALATGLTIGGTLMSMFGGKKKKKAAPKRRMDLGRFYQPTRGY